MRKMVAILLTLVMVLTLSMSAMATTEEKERETGITASATTVNVGDTVDFTAVTLKHGSSFASPTWKINNVTQSEVVDSTSFHNDYYTTTRSFTFNEAGTYTVSYEIVMAAGRGKSQVQFVATDSITITVIAPQENPVSIIDLEIANYRIVETGNSGNLKLIILELEVFYSNNTSEIVQVSGPDYEYGNWPRRINVSYGGFSKVFELGSIE